MNCSKQQVEALVDALYLAEKYCLNIGAELIRDDKNEQAAKYWSNQYNKIGELRTYILSILNKINYYDNQSSTYSL